ncbi:MAG: N-acetylmuramoyl-L-alanine amidase [Flavobacteriaceae bacterium]|jgi:N-acetylmuramoyl-L-alanine amidase|nr:N-acetylmuramoyl-L-alanine amidase [Flavobacteriaceae bacterium]
MIYLSAGHSNADSGAVANGNKEADITKLLRDEIKKRLKSVITDYDWETNAQHQNRIKPGSGSVIFDIHLNAAGTAAARGVECYVNKADFANKNSLSYQMAKVVCEEYSRILGIPNRGVKPENNSQHSRIGILNLGAGIAVLCEVDFITHPEAVKNIKKILNEIAFETADILEVFEDLKM